MRVTRVLFGGLVLVGVVVIAAGCAPTKTVSAPTTAAPPAATSPSSEPPLSSHASSAKKTRTTLRRAHHPARVVARQRRAAAPAPASSSLTLITEPGQGIEPIDAFLARPDKTLDLTMYEFVDTDAEQILAVDAARGVTVRVVLDQNRERSANTPAYKYLGARGVHVRWAPASYEAAHEKAAVVDAGRSDAEALIMTLNLTSRYYATTRDFAVVDRNSADIDAIENVFDADYSGATDAVTPHGTDLVWSPGAEPDLVALINSARSRVAVENEEMGDPTIIAALSEAAQRGVDVEVAKAIVVDGTKAFAGSQNFSDASLDDNRELGITTTAPAVVSGLAATLAADYAAAPAASSSVSAAAGPSTAQSSGVTPLRSPSGRLYRAGEDCSSRDLGLTTEGSDGEITCESQPSGYNQWVDAN